MITKWHSRFEELVNANSFFMNHFATPNIGFELKVNFGTISPKFRLKKTWSPRPSWLLPLIFTNLKKIEIRDRTNKLLGNINKTVGIFTQTVYSHNKANDLSQGNGKAAISKKYVRALICVTLVFHRLVLLLWHSDPAQFWGH